MLNKHTPKLKDKKRKKPTPLLSEDCVVDEFGYQIIKISERYVDITLPNGYNIRTPTDFLFNLFQNIPTIPLSE